MPFFFIVLDLVFSFAIFNWFQFLLSISFSSSSDGKSTQRGIISGCPSFLPLLASFLPPFISPKRPHLWLLQQVDEKRSAGRVGGRLAQVVGGRIRRRRIEKTEEKLAKNFNCQSTYCSQRQHKDLQGRQVHKIS
jgi:hypothetical protein